MRRVTAQEVTDAVLAGDWVVDLRGPAAFARGHVAGTVNVAYDEEFADRIVDQSREHVGWLLPCEDDIVLLTDRPDVLDPAEHVLASLGIVRVATHLLESDEPLPAAYAVRTWSDFLAPDPDGTHRLVIDVRDRREYDAGHVRGALHLRLRDVEQVAPSLPRTELWVHCADGRRAATAASVLHRMGHRVVHLDDPWESVARLGLVTSTGFAA